MKYYAGLKMEGLFPCGKDTVWYEVTEERFMQILDIVVTAPTFETNK